MDCDKIVLSYLLHNCNETNDTSYCISNYVDKEHGFGILIKFLTILSTSVLFIGVGLQCSYGRCLYHVRTPIGILIGFTLQYTVMPLLAVILAKIFSIDERFVLNVFIVGCSPGGNLSNVIVMFIQGDINLSVSMTAVNTILGFFMMPLLVKVYGPFIDIPDHLTLPKVPVLMLALILIVLPIAVGYRLRKSIKIAAKNTNQVPKLQIDFWKRMIMIPALFTGLSLVPFWYYLILSDGTSLW